uniref:Integrase, catalytic region, zinc finger, CCHC-type, peptidase aspartic, catalytic n=1 Tax=Tanacetum cinerariifolium TaxID=118510 RepID=A0A6L2P6P8_TANCI|nr:integrase, catalytic region, zinc finger, CCHC-type, peptidase aspartic, catalytic [Tanacetum cinerariifolium]
MMKSSLICLLSKAFKNKSWLWYHRLNHLNFGTINDLARKDLVRGLPRLKFEKDHLCSACHLEYYENVAIFHQKIVPRTPRQNGVVERRNHTLVEAARTMLIFSKAPMFLWAEVVATACYTLNRSLIYTRRKKTPYELVHTVRSCTSESAEVYYGCMEPFKSLMYLWVRNRSTATIWLEKVVTPLIVPAIKGFAAESAVLKPKRLKVDKHSVSEPMSYYLID